MPGGLASLKDGRGATCAWDRPRGGDRHGAAYVDVVLQHELCFLVVLGDLVLSSGGTCGWVDQCLVQR